MVFSQSRKTVLLIGIIIFLTGAGIYRLATSPRCSQPSRTLIIGTTSGYAPYVTLNSKGDYEGFDIDFMKALAQTTNRELIIKDFGSLTALFVALEQNKVDAVIWALSITPSRLKTVDMIYYQGALTTRMPLVFWNNIPTDIATLGDLKNYPELTVSVEAGSIQESILSKYSFVPRCITDKVSDTLLNLKYGKAQAALLDPSIASNLMSKMPELKSISVLLTEEEQILGNGIALKKGNTALQQELQEAVQCLQQKGVISALEQQWNLKD